MLMGAQDRLIRQYQILAAISRARRGLSAAQIEADLGISRSTLYRDLDVLRSAGIPIDLTESRYQILNAREMPPLGLSHLQFASLCFARAQLAPLAGTLLLKELDRFLGSLKPEQKKPLQLPLDFKEPQKPVFEPKILRIIEKALTSRKRIHIEYRAASRRGAPTHVQIEPLILRVAEADPYVHAYCVERQAERTYKLTRITNAKLTGEPFSSHAVSALRNGESPYSHSIKAWSGPPTRIKVRLESRVAWLAREYPLPGQTEHPNPDGSVTILATVAGTVEAQRRIFAWGGAAEVLDPPELRDSIRAELATALANYDGPGPVKAPRKKEESTEAPGRSVKQGGTRAG